MAAATCCLNGCRLTDNKDDVVKNIDPEFRIDLFEELNETRQFQFQIASIEEQECSNASINLTFSQFPTHLVLNLLEIMQPDTCHSPMAPAIGTAKTVSLPTGRYELKINLKNTIFNAGTLDVKSDLIKVRMETKDGFELVHSELRRIPMQTIWGYAAYNDPALGADRAAQFYEEVKGLCQSDGLGNGYYGYFDLSGNQELELIQQPDFSHLKTFHFRLPGNLQQLEDLLAAYRTGPNGDLMEFKIFTWEGDTL